MRRRLCVEHVGQMAGRSERMPGVIAEALESRVHPTAVFWDGGAGTTSWHDAANWNRGGVDALPQDGDAVTISVATNPTITFSTGSVALASLVTNEVMSITGGSLGLEAGGTADINARLNIQGGTIQGGTWDVMGGSLRATSAGGSIIDAHITGDILVNASSAKVRIAGTTRFAAVRLEEVNVLLEIAAGYTLHDSIVSSTGGFGSRVVRVVDGPGIFTVAPTGVIRVPALVGGALDIQGTDVTLINNGLIAADGNPISLRTTTSINNASLTAASILTVTGAFTNTGALTLTGGRASLTGSWSNSGTISVSNATLNLGGTFNTAGIGTINRTGGAINLTGIFTNTGATLTLNSTSGSWNLAGGTIVGGVINLLDATRIVVTETNSSLTDVHINGDVLVSTENITLNVNGDTRFTALRLAATNLNAWFSPGFILHGLISVEGTASGNRFIRASVGEAASFTVAPTGAIRVVAGAGGPLTITSPSTFTFINNGEVSSGGHRLSFFQGAVVNNGSMTATFGTIDIQATTFTNLGAITSANSSTFTIGGTWSSPGTITVVNAVINLGGTFSVHGFTLSRTGGTVNITGTMDNTGNTLTFDDSIGSWTLNGGGTILGGVVNFSASHRLILSGGTLENVQVNAELVANSVNTGVGFRGTTRFASLRLSASNTSAFLRDGYILLDPIIIDGPGSKTVNGSGTATIAAGTSVSVLPGVGATLSFAGTLINYGLLSCEATTGSLQFSAQSMINHGTISVTTGALATQNTFVNDTDGVIIAAGVAVNFGGDWLNRGAILVVNTTLNLGGQFTMPPTGVINRTNTTVNLTGSFNNAGSTFTFSSATGSWNLRGGNVTGGTLVFTGANRLVPTTQTGALYNVQINSDIVLDTPGARLYVSGTTRFTSLRLAAANATLEAQEGYIIRDLIVVEGEGVGDRVVRGAASNTGTLAIASTSTVRVAAGAGGGLAFINGNSTTFVNNGLIVNEAADRTISFRHSLTINNGTIRAIAGTIDIGSTEWRNLQTISLADAALITSATWFSTGSITSENSSITLGGTFNIAGFSLARTGGTVNLTGAAMNSGNTLAFSSSTGSWNLAGGTINGGTIIQNGPDRLAFTPMGGSLVDVQVNGDLIVDVTSASVRVAGTTRFAVARLTENNAAFEAAPGYVIQDVILADGSATGTRVVRGGAGGDGALTVASTGVIRVASGAGGGIVISSSGNVTFTNNGLVTSEANDRAIEIAVSSVANVVAGTLTGGRWVATGTAAITLPAAIVITTNNADVTVGSPNSFPAMATLNANTGSLTILSDGAFTITPTSALLTNNGTLTIEAGGTLAVTGHVVMATQAVLNVRIRGVLPSDIGRIAATGDVTLGGTLNISPANGWTPTNVNTVFVTANQVLGQFATQSLPTPPALFNSFTSQSANQVLFIISPPSDYNLDGVVNSQDFFDFLVSFFASNPSSDFNHDGILNTQDFFDFLAVFFPG